ncbi:MAG TPA: TIM-barrel domain-containing protein [Steroidobacteraceae bacterium]|nr:TIM-barrel domain-containing protein [Steroidobacteraceae bacterium]
MRFEFLTPSLLRMEYSSSGQFVDAPTAVVKNRDWPRVAVRVSREDGWLVEKTSAVTVRYRLGSGRFEPGNLEVTWTEHAGRRHRWYPGEVDPGNLGGLTYSLDNISKANLPAGHRDLESPVDDVIPGIDLRLAPAKPGLLSRSGYAFLDDSGTPVWNARTAWIEPRADRHDQDWYLFTYGRDYRKVLAEYARLCGPIPMIPRYVLGPWITDFNFEYFPGSAQAARPEFRRYDQAYLESEVARFRAERIPLDVLVLDFGWHDYGWQGGYDWSPSFPHPVQLSDWLHGRGIKLSLNDHPGYVNTDESILSYRDSHARRVLRDLGRAPPAAPSFQRNIAGSWQFSTDPRRGRWTPIRVGAPWRDQGFAADRRVGWYRARIPLPAQLPRALYLYLGEVAQSYRLFVNGREVPHSRAHWPRRLTYAVIAAAVEPGRQNLILLRVVPGKRGGGILLGPTSIRNVAPPRRIHFDLSNARQAEVFMRDLHRGLMHRGVDVWWVDGGSGAVAMPGLDEQLWTNRVYYDYTERLTGRRAFILGRYGDWGSERYPGFFTGDTYSEWPVLAYEVAFTARGGNVLVPYISNDIGGFHGAKIDFDLYARWVEFGAFSPILRMHSAHENPLEGNVRMPWVYGDRGIALARKYFTLRTQLIPYLYTNAWLAHTESMPLLRPLYLQYPDLAPAYRHTHEYFFGSEMLVAPVLAASGMRAVYLPPGRWIDFFTGKRYTGGAEFTAHYAVDETPVFVRDGALIPEQAASAYSNQKPLDPVILDVFGSGPGRFDLYEDDGISLSYAKGRYALTPMTYVTERDGLHRLGIGPTEGAYRGQLPSRGYELRIHVRREPSAMAVDGVQVGQMSWNARRAVATVALAPRSIRDRIRVSWH